MDELQFYRLAWSGDGTRLALFETGRVRTWDLTTQEMTRDFPVASGLVLRNCGWVGNTHVVVNGRILVDVERRIPVAVLSGVFDSDVQLLDGVLWTLAGLGRGPATIKGKAALPKNFKDPAKGQTAEQLLLVRPGDEVAVDLPPSASPDGSDPHTAVIRQLEKNGMKIVPDSKIRLVGTLNSADTGPILAISFTVDGETVWSHTARIGPPGRVQVKNGESVGQAISSEQNPNENDPVRVWIPARVRSLPRSKPRSLEKLAAHDTLAMIAASDAAVERCFMTARPSGHPIPEIPADPVPRRKRLLSLRAVALCRHDSRRIGTDVRRRLRSAIRRSSPLPAAVRYRNVAATSRADRVRSDGAAGLRLALPGIALHFATRRAKSQDAAANSCSAAANSCSATAPASERPFANRLAHYLEEEPTPAVRTKLASSRSFFMKLLPGPRRGPKSASAICAILLRIHCLAARRPVAQVPQSRG